MKSIRFLGSLLVILVCLESCNSPDTQLSSIPEKIDFNYHIKPILSDRCFACHGPDEKAREADLRLDLEETAFAALSDNPSQFAIVKGDVEKSVLIHRIDSDDPEEVMPPPSSNLYLSNREKQLITKWIEQGAEWKQHWSFISPEKAKLPKPKNKKWAKNEIDHFVLHKMEQVGFSPAKRAKREKLIRRVHFDITGLPPSLDEIEAFVNDDAPDAYENLVKGLLESPHYGERMASIWLDISRYADSHGYQDDRPRTMWPWRDWVVKAFNDNLTYDQFITWQLAGDLLPNPSYEQKLATGFNRNHGITQEGGVVNEEYVTEYVADRTQTMSTAFLGLTMECARCHDHKYDPISQKDYYQLFAFFNNIPERGQISYFDLAPTPNIQMEDSLLAKEIAAIQGTIDSLENIRSSFPQKYQDEFKAWLKSDWPRYDLEDAVKKDLVGHFTFDSYEGLSSPSTIGPRDAIANLGGLQGELKAPKFVAGKMGKAFEFDGENFMDLGDIGDFDHFQPFSLGAWIKGRERTDKEHTILSRRNGEQKREGLSLVLSKEGYLRLKIIHALGGDRLEVRSKEKVDSQNWSHVFATYDGSSLASGIQLYINGSLQKTEIEADSLKGKYITNGNNLLAGNFTYRNSKRGHIEGFKHGTIDEVRVFDREITAIEVMHLAEKNPKSLYKNLSLQAKKKWQSSHLFQLFAQNQAENKQVNGELLLLRRKDRSLPKIMVLEEMDTMRHSFVLDRGQYSAKMERVYPNTPKYLPAFPESLPKNRLGLAQWLTQKNHPLTSRVMVNRLWQMIFDQGLVGTPEDFGNQGALPSHPELLDWLAVDFAENNWDVKALLSKIFLSATYQQSSEIDPQKRTLDPENILLTRGPNQRLSAEMIRDNALAASGLLQKKIGGKWVKPYQAPGLWKELANQIGENKYRQGRGAELFRRSLYTYWKRTIPPPTMLTFDAPERVVCTVKRSPTSTPLQSLVMLNDETYIEAARYLAENLMREANEDEGKKIEEAFLLFTSRKPSNQEIKVLRELFESERFYFSQRPSDTDDFLGTGTQAIDPELPRDELAALTVVINAIMNLDEAKMKS